MPLINFQGHNGSGKTTLIDALTLVYYGEDTNNLNYTSMERRSVAGAIHWGMANRARRPGKTYSYIILEAQDANDKIYHQGIRYMSKANSEKVDEMVYFWGEGTLESIHADDPQVTDAGSVWTDKRQRTSNREKAFDAFFVRRGYLETFRKATVNGKTPQKRFRDFGRNILDNKSANDTTDSQYIRTAVFPDTETGDIYKNIADTIYNLRCIEAKDAENKKKEEFLRDIFTKGNDFINAADRYLFGERMAPFINMSHYDREVRRLTTELSENEAEQDKYRQKDKQLLEEHDALLKEQTKIENTDDIERAAERALEAAKNSLKAAATDYKRYEEYHTAEAEILAATGIQTAVNKTVLLKAADAYLDSLRDESDSLASKIFENESKIRNNDDLIRTLEGNLMQSASNNAIAQMRADAEALKRNIENECPGATPKILYECVERIKDEEWQEAVESLIGNNRFGIIVEPEYYDRACSIQHRCRGNKRDSIVLNTRNKREAKNGTVPELFVCNDVNAQRYLDSTYGVYKLCESDREYSNAEYALRKNGQYKVPGRSVKPGSFRKVVLVFGSEALERTINELHRENAALRKSTDEHEAKKSELAQKTDSMIENKRTVLNNSEFASETFKECYEKAVQSAAEAEKELKNVRMSDIVQRKYEALREIARQLKENEKQRGKNRENSRIAENMYENTKNAMSTAKGQLDAFKKQAANFEEPTEEDKRRAEEENLLTILLGDVNVNTRLLEWKGAMQAKKELMVTTYSHYKDIRDKFVNLPDEIRTKADLQRISEELEIIDNLVFDSQLREQLRRLNYSLEQSYCMCLQSVYEEYKKALELRDEMNKIISKYQIGNFYYRLGPIISMSTNELDILELAKIQCEQGIQLDYSQMNKLNALCQKAYDAHWNPFDYRYYITTEVQCKGINETVWKNSSRVRAANSNGQQGILRYLFKVIVLYSQAFNDKSLNFIFTDEALGGIDETNSKYFFDIIKELGVQCIIASHEDRFAEYADLGYIFHNEDDCVIPLYYKIERNAS